MAFHPAPVDLVSALGNQLIQLLPKVNVLDRLLGGRLPAFGLPAHQPLGHAFEHVLAVQVQGHRTGTFEGGQRLDDRRHLHAVVGGAHFTAKHLFFRAVGRAQQGTPATGARIAFAGTVCIDNHFVQSLVSLTENPLSCARFATDTDLRALAGAVFHAGPSKRTPRTRLTATRK